MIRPRRVMNQMNRAALMAAGANPAAIAEAACGSGQLPEHNPLEQNPRGSFGGGGGFTGGARMGNAKYPTAYRSRAPHYGSPAVGGEYTSNLLSNSQKLWLHRRALWFAIALEQMLGRDPTLDEIAYFGATGLVGDDYDQITHGVTPGWSSSQWTAAFNYVHDNFGAWWTDAYPPA